ncbi:protein YTP1 [Phialemonium atrogriseum]|uniref:Protein YTP1 n=1 Tax=Phialemonium atrogriseum TaxID=1093897 RepID=A0AAJ0BPT0_9PEZI|nr:protein YTP1 [Phialemonium atrogriseum]KAK1761965.1 protein YTP1 [Phialemonium atrogriseum]
MMRSPEGRGNAASSLLQRLPQSPSASAAAVVIVAAAFLPVALAHDHGTENIEEGATVSADPIDATLWAHIFIQALAFGILYPIGMVLGMIKSRWHVPLQVLATIIAFLGYALGHMHKGRQFVPNNVHSKFATPLYIILIVQIILGVYLRLHLERGFHGRVRPVIRLLHSINGKAFPVVSWTQMLFGGITTLGFCQGDHLGQCLAHFIMGSAFIAYGILLTILLLVGQLWLKRTGRSQEFFDSVVIAAWGCVNTFTEHRWGTAWVKNDWQHTTMGIIWWCAGLAGVWLSKGRDGQPKRNFIPGFVILITGWAMSAHPQALHTSAATHSMFGYTLMAAGLTRIIEISFVVKDKTGISEDGYEINSFQYLPVFLLYASGFLFMGATEEQMAFIASSSMDHVAYILILYSLAFLVFLFAHVLIHLYDRAANSPAAAKIAANGRVRPGDRALDDTQLRDAEEFELDGLVSEDEDEEQAARRKLLREDGSDEDAGLASPSTLGRNSDRTAP